MKIAFVEPHLELFGGIRRIVELASRLSDRGHDVTIYHSDGSPCRWLECRAATAPARAVLERSHDALVFNDPSPLDYDLARRADARVKAFYVLGLYQKDRLVGRNPRLLLPGAGRLRILRRCLHGPWLKLANATWERDWLGDRMGIDAETLLGGTDTDLFHPTEPTDRRNDTGDLPVRIVASGDPRRFKGTDTIEEAVDRLRRGGVAVEFETYHGKGIAQADMSAAYARADVFVDATWPCGAGWNNPVAEAMACGVPVVCTDIGAVHDFAEHERTAFLVPPGDSASMARAIRRLLDDRDLRERLVTAALERIRSFRWDDTVERFEQIVSEHLVVNPSYAGPRDDVAALVPTASRSILDVGCAGGALGARLRRRAGVRVVGVEMDRKMADMAAKKLDRVLIGDAETLDLENEIGNDRIDCAVFADVLEHQRDPWRMLRRVSALLLPGGTVVASIPNVRHHSTFYALLFGRRWPYRDRGIHDRTHLRHFALANIRELFSGAGLEIARVERKFRLIDRPSRWNRYARFAAFPPLRDLLTYQFLVVAQKRAGETSPDKG